MNKSTFQLLIDDQEFTGWQAVSFETDMEALVSTFSIQARDQYGTLSAIDAGTACELYIERDNTQILVLTGYVTSRDRELSSGAHTVTINGSSNLVDLVDCSVVQANRSWVKKKFSAIVEAIASPFGIDVDKSDLTSDPVIDRMTLQSSEDAFSAIERLCRSQAVLPLSTFDGKLKLGYAASVTDRSPVDIAEGSNLKAIRETSDWTERFSDYIGLSQVSAKGKQWSSANLQGKAVANDPTITRYRPKLFVTENSLSQTEIPKRVAWEAQVRAGRSTTYVITVDGWFHKISSTEVAGSIWENNKRVQLTVPTLDIDADLLISSVTYSLDNSGEITNLTLRHPDTYKADPSAEVKLT